MKDVEIIQLEAGSILVRWKSLEGKEPDCRFYEIIFEGSRHKIEKFITAEKEREYTYLLPRDEAITLAGDVIVHVKAVKERRKPTKTESVASFRVYR